MPWPAPALLAWGWSWLAYNAAQKVEIPHWAAILIPLIFSLIWTLHEESRWRKLFIFAGFPLSWAILQGSPEQSPWLWFLPIPALLLIYPPQTWKDAPIFPTPANALQGIEKLVPINTKDAILDAGCGLGHGMKALKSAYPQARIHGSERSIPLVIACWALHTWAKVSRADMWRQSWSDFKIVYVFHRPDTMPQAMKKAKSELKKGAWLLSLEFFDPDYTPTATWTCPDGRKVYAYQAPIKLSRMPRQTQGR